MGLGHTDNESAQHFDLEKTIFLVLQAGFEPLVFGYSRVDALPTQDRHGSPLCELVQRLKRKG